MMQPYLKYLKSFKKSILTPIPEKPHSKKHSNRIRSKIKQRELLQVNLHEVFIKSHILNATLNWIDDEVLMAFKARELLNKENILSTIVFLHHRDVQGCERWGYIDLAQSWSDYRLRKTIAFNWRFIYEGKYLLMPRQSDLCFNDVCQKLQIFNNSKNYKIVYDKKYGILLMHREDGTVFPLGKIPPQFEKIVVRSMKYSKRYGPVVFYDHYVR